MPFIDYYAGKSVADLDFRHLEKDIDLIVMERALRLPTDMAYLIRTNVVLEGIARTLEPEFSFVEAARPSLSRWLFDDRIQKGIKIENFFRGPRRAATSSSRNINLDLGKLENQQVQPNKLASLEDELKTAKQKVQEYRNPSNFAGFAQFICMANPYCNKKPTRQQLFFDWKWSNGGNYIVAAAKAKSPYETLITCKNGWTIDGGNGKTMLKWRAAARTDAGCQRQRNEDNYYMSPDQRVFVVADGMGGAAGGAKASQLAVEAIEKHWKVGPPPLTDRIEVAKWLLDAVNSANESVWQEAEQDASVRGMGTTVVVAVQSEDNFVQIAHVGDSRAYLVERRQADASY